MKRILLVFALCLLAAACFKSERLLLDLGRAAHPVADGTWANGEGGEGDSFTLTAKGDHYLRVEGENRYDVVLVPMPGHEHTFMAAESAENCTGDDATPECNWEYAIVRVEPDGNWSQTAPNCKEPWDGWDRDVAKRADDGETCWFDEAAGLEHALQQAADKPGGNTQQFRRPAPKEAATTEAAEAESAPAAEAEPTPK
jgi:hypothetical protein